MVKAFQREKLLAVDVEGSFGIFAPWVIKLAEGHSDIDPQDVDLIVSIYDGFEFEQIGRQIVAPRGRANGLCVQDVWQMWVQDADFTVSRDHNGELVFLQVGENFPAWPSKPHQATACLPAGTRSKSRHISALAVSSSGTFPCSATWRIEVPQHTREADAQQVVNLIHKELDKFSFKAKPGTRLDADECVEYLEVTRAEFVTANRDKPDFVVTRDWKRAWVLEKVREPLLVRSTRPRPRRTASVVSVIGAEVN